jgi:hypothetical protein
MTLADPKLISLTTMEVGKKIKDKKREFLDPRVTNIKRYNGWFREQFGQRFAFSNFFPTMADNA